MQPALAVGALLQNRYRIVQLLGQGGFGRTYLTKDQGRFEEQCVIKEFMPVGGGDRFSSKAAQLFQREAEILYQISHPQIPQFRATFEQDQRLFLVQDYIEGLTYREILLQRPGQAFSETEIRAFLGQLLPVLAHIHAKGIIHRDISPENIILRRSDQRPVLIDFGVVKEVVTRLQTDVTTTQATTVGKAGYAPSEQIQSGRAYPSSDLYALAVTVLVLMTGKEPHELFDDTTLSWNWQPFTQVSDQLAAVLNKALSYRPSDRYQSVSEIAQALQQGGSTRAVSTGAPQSPTRRPTAKPQQQSISEIRTVAVGSIPTATQAEKTDMGGARSAATNAKTTNASRTQVVTSPKGQGGMDNPLALAAMFLGATALAGFGGWATVNYVLKPDPPSQNNVIQPLPAPEELETQPNQAGTPEPKPLEPEGPTNYTSPLELAVGDQKTVEGGIKKGDTVNYEFEGKAGQTLQTALTGDGVVLSVLDADGQELRGGRRVSDWQGELPEDGRYTVQVRTARGTEQSTYGLTLGLEEAAPDGPDENDDSGDNPPDDDTDNDDGTGTDNGTTGDDVPEEPEDVPPPQEQVSSQRVQFPEGATGTLLANSVGPGRVQRYLVNAQQGQIVTVKITQANGPVTFDVAFPGGEQIADAEGVLYWNSYLPLGGDYIIDVQSASAAEFTLDVQVVGQGTASP